MISYDKAYVAAFRNIAVTSVDQLEVGKTYYSNSHGTFTLKRLMTNAEQYEKDGLTWGNKNTANDIAWFQTTEGRGGSLLDANIGASYNPWLIFTTEEKLKAYQAELVITYDHSEDWWDDEF